MYLVGDTIKRLRKKRSLTQDKLAGDALGREYLSKIENNKIAPSVKILVQLFERLGYDPNLYIEFFMDKESVKFQTAIDALSTFLREENLKEAKKIVEQLERNDRFMSDKFNRQCLLSRKAGLIIDDRDKIKETRKILLEAIKITIPKYEENKIKDYLLTKEDIYIINKLAILYDSEGRKEEHLKLLCGLKENFDSRYMDIGSKGRHYPMIVSNVARAFIALDRHKEAMAVCEEGIAFCIESGFMGMLPSFAINQAQCLCKFEDYDSCRELLMQAYYTSKLQGDNGMAETIKSYAQEDSRTAF